MGSELVSGSQSPTGDGSGGSVPRSFTKEFKKHLPFYLSIGMSVTEFYDASPCLAEHYRRAYRLRTERKNREAWLAGAYIYEALCDAAPLFRSLAPSGTKAHPYPAEPYPLTGVEAQGREERRQTNATAHAMAHVSAWAADVNLRMAEERKEKNNG